MSKPEPNSSAAAKLLTLCIIAAAVGCAQSRTYDITVKNSTDMPFTLWLTKDGGPDERDWMSPEVMAISDPSEDDTFAPPVAGPGEIIGATLGGKFDPSTRAVLRVYQGDLKLAGVLAISNPSEFRRDVILRPGANDFDIVKGQETLFEVKRGTPGPSESR